jgi:hypothetical protein
MNDAMIWTFGILAFIVLITLVSKIGKAGRGRALRDLTGGESQELKRFGEDLAEIKTRLTGIENILRSVE